MAVSAPDNVFAPGVIVGGKYRVIRLVGTGGVGHVYRATHIELDTDVALKVLKPEMATRPDIVSRFQREARASVRLQSEHIARVHDVGTHEGQPFFVMEYLLGSDLATHARDNQLGWGTLAELAIQACEGLAVAHARNVVHRDVKPENLYVVKDDSGWRTLKILDFGISKIALTGKVSEVDVASMRTEVMMGTPHYISPEQIRSTRDVDHRTDLWSLGVVLFEIASGGTMPFREERDVAALIAEILERPHRSLAEVAPGTPPELVAIIDRCLEKDPSKRYQTAAEVAAALLPLAPKRARASAERASAAIRAAGLGDTDLHSSRPPRPSDQSIPYPSVPGPPRNPTPAPDAYAATMMGPSSSPASAPAVATTSRIETLPAPGGLPSSSIAAPPASKLPIVVVGAVAIAAIVAVVILMRDRAGADKREVPTMATTATSTGAPPTASATSPTTPSATTTTAPDPTISASASASASATPSTTAATPPTHRSPFVPRATAPFPPTPPTSKPSTSTPPSGGGLEIRHER